MMRVNINEATSRRVLASGRPHLLFSLLFSFFKKNIRFANHLFRENEKVLLEIAIANIQKVSNEHN